jgi:ferredoxin
MMLYIDPNDCIDCEACVPVCPVEAIFSEGNVPQQWNGYIQINTDKCAAIKAGGAAAITDKQDAKKGSGCKK